MTISIRQVGPCFAGEVEGIDMRRPLSKEEVAAIHAGMDQYAVLVFRDQKIDDGQQLAFTRSLGEIEHAIGTSLRAAPVGMTASCHHRSGDQLAGTANLFSCLSKVTLSCRGGGQTPGFIAWARRVSRSAMFL